MKSTLRFISISHKTATVAQRERFYIPDSGKKEVVRKIRKCYPDISGLLLLVTCNRTEIYFESLSTKASELNSFLISGKKHTEDLTYSHLFRKGDTTLATVRHLLMVSSGLSSQVLGDAEIVHQLKKAYQFAIELKLQGSLLERAMQTVFKTHKRISNETEFRDGTTSVAYKSLKVVSETYRGRQPVTRKILLIGTGDIARQLLKYNAKFNFTNIFISNRTSEKARVLAAKYNCKVYSWQKVLDNEFGDFDVIISAVSNCRHLISRVDHNGSIRLLIDLALPGNIDGSVAKTANVSFYDLDAICAELEETKDKRLAAIKQVNLLIEIGLKEFNDWLKDAPFRSLLADYKIILKEKIIAYYQRQDLGCDRQTISKATDRVMRKLLKQANKALSPESIDAMVKEYALIE